MWDKNIKWVEAQILAGLNVSKNLLQYLKLTDALNVTEFDIFYKRWNTSGILTLEV